MLRVLEAADMLLPKQQHRVRVGGRPFVLDYAYVSQRRFIEYYELGSHSTPSAVAYDNERLTLLCNAGWLPLIFTDETTDAEIVARTREAIGSGAADRAGDGITPPCDGGVMVGRSVTSPPCDGGLLAGA